MSARGSCEGELINFSTCSCVLWQKEQRKGSSGLNFFTGMEASSPLGFDGVCNPILGRLLPGTKEKVDGLLTFWNWRSFLLQTAKHSAARNLAVLVNNFVDHPVFLGLLGIHDVVAIDVFFNPVHRLPAVLCQ